MIPRTTPPVILRSKATKNLKTIMNYYVYILMNWNNKVIYVGVTNNLERRLYEHKNGLYKGFTKKYNIKKLVYYEWYNDIKEAISREKEIKGWKRYKKNLLVESNNPDWKDISENW